MLWFYALQKSAAHTEMRSRLGVLVHFLMHFLISQSTHHAVLRTPSDTDYHLPSSSSFSSSFPSLPAGPELIVFALLINLYPPQGMSHIGFWMNTGCAGTKTCPAFSNEFQPFRAVGELACCDWHLLRRTVWLWNGMKAEFSWRNCESIPQQSTTWERGHIWLNEIMAKFDVMNVSVFEVAWRSNTQKWHWRYPFGVYQLSVSTSLPSIWYHLLERIIERLPSNLMKRPKPTMNWH